jgi:hypothetical protein
LTVWCSVGIRRAGSNGLAFANQAVSFDPGVNAFGAVLSNAALGIVDGL